MNFRRGRTAKAASSLSSAVQGTCSPAPPPTLNLANVLMRSRRTLNGFGERPSGISRRSNHGLSRRRLGKRLKVAAERSAVPTCASGACYIIPRNWRRYGRDGFGPTCARIPKIICLPYRQIRWSKCPVSAGLSGLRRRGFLYGSRPAVQQYYDTAQAGASRWTGNTGRPGQPLLRARGRATASITSPASGTTGRPKSLSQ